MSGVTSHELAQGPYHSVPGSARRKVCPVRRSRHSALAEPGHISDSQQRSHLLIGLVRQLDCRMSPLHPKVTELMQPINNPDLFYEPLRYSLELCNHWSQSL
jgi:hypothetical protein